MGSNEERCEAKKGTAIVRTMNKIKVAGRRVGFNLRQLFKPLDPGLSRLMTMSKFVGVLSGEMKGIIGLSDEEILQLAQYFKVGDGRVAYTEFLDTVLPEPPEEKPQEEVKEEMLKSNTLSHTDEKYMLMMLTRIAIIITDKKLDVLPFFKDYSIVKKEAGTVTRAHFSRALTLMGIELSNREYELLIRKYSLDSLTVKYAAFLADINRVVHALNQQPATSRSKDLLSEFPGRLEWRAPDIIPRPEFDPPESISRPQPHPLTLEKIRSHLSKQRIRIGRLLELYDETGCGRVTRAQLLIVLQETSKCIGMGNPLLLTPLERNQLCTLYADPIDPERVLYRNLVTDIEAVWREEELACWGGERERLGKEECERRARQAARFRWAQEEHPAPPPPDVAAVLADLQRKMSSRGIELKPSLLTYDTERLGTVSRAQFRSSLIDNYLLLTEAELVLLEEEFSPVQEFNYIDLLAALEPYKQSPTNNKNDAVAEELLMKREKEKARLEKLRETDIIEVLAKIKRRIICLKVNTLDFLAKYDKENTDLITKAELESGLKDCGLQLSNTEINTVYDVFKEGDGVVYKKFAMTVDDTSGRQCLVTGPAIQDGAAHLPVHPFLNFEERIRTSITAKKLADKMSLGTIELFKAEDKEGLGVVTRHQLDSLLHRMGLLHLVSPQEVDTLVKAFGLTVTRGEPDDVSSICLDYTSFLNALDIVYRTQKAASV